MSRIYKRPGSKKWWADFVDPSHPKAGTGGRVRIPLDTDKDRAQEELGRLLGTAKSIVTGRPQKDVSYEGFKERFIRQVSTKNRVTLQGYLRAIRNLEENLFTPIKILSQITPSLLSDIKTAWIEKKRGLYVRNRDIQSIKAMMHTAEAWGLVHKQDWTAVKCDKEPKGRLLWYTVKEVKDLLRVSKGVWKTIAMIGARAGFRRSEIYWLSWKDVDFERNRLHISPKPEWSPKDHERRWVPMSKDLRDYLKAAPKVSEWVIDEGEGRPTVGSMTIYFRRLSKKAGLKGNIHTLRHSYGSQLASAGVSIYVIKDLMGHSKVEMTARYAHLASSALQSAAQSLPRL